jgi:hypothetical protein
MSMVGLHRIDYSEQGAKENSAMIPLKKTVA